MKVDIFYTGEYKLLTFRHANLVTVKFYSVGHYKSCKYYCVFIVRKSTFSQFPDHRQSEKASMCF